MMRTVFRPLVFVIALCCMFMPRAFAALAQPAQESAPQVSVQESAEREEGIVNWWSWDYGPHAKDPDHRGWPPPFGFALINFAIFVALIGHFIRPPLKEFLRDRHHRIRRDLDEAARLRKEAQAEIDACRKRVANIDEQIEELLAGIRKEAETEKARLVAAAEAEAERLKSDAERQIRVEVERARLELRQQVVEVASRFAEDLLQKKMSPEDQRRMAESFVGRLEHGTIHEKRA
jgi:F-type H+-transporting ATPase subunit b